MQTLNFVGHILRSYKPSKYGVKKKKNISYVMFNKFLLIPRLHQGAKRLQCYLDFMNKIDGRSNIEFS